MVVGRKVKSFGVSAMLTPLFYKVNYMKKLIVIAALLGSLSACGVARTAGGVAVGAGQLALGAADVVL